MKRTMQVTIQVEVHPMSEEDVREAFCLDEDEDCEDPEELFADADLDEIAMAIADYVTSDDNEALAGSGQFVTLKKADLLRTEWVANSPADAP